MRKKTAAEERLDEIKGLVLLNDRGELIADGDGWVKFWFSKPQAMQVAAHLSQRLEMSLRVVQNSRELWNRPCIAVRGTRW